MTAFADLVRAGKALYIGVSSGRPSRSPGAALALSCEVR